MEGELWSEVYRVLNQEGKKRWRPKHVQFSDTRILEVFFWAVIHDRPTCWACCPDNWPPLERSGDLPSNATMSIRLRKLSVRLLLQSVLDRLHAGAKPVLARRLDSKPLVVGCYSKDHEARWGFAAKAHARGYKMFCVWGTSVAPDAWTLGPMNRADSVAGMALVPQLTHAAYLLGDAGYDSNALHRVCEHWGMQLVAPRKKPGTNLGHSGQEPGRLRSMQMLEWPVMLGTAASPFGHDLYAMRGQIERDYGNLCGFGGGLQPLPSWVRTPHRVAMWVEAKLVINAIRKFKNAGLAA